jgi:phosphoglycerate dehydrogenase-like enzyme
MMKDAVGLITRGVAIIDGPLMDAAPGLRFITRTGSGYENVDIAAATERKLPVVYAPLLADSVAEATMTMLLAVTKRLLYWHKALLAGEWDRRITERTVEILGQTLGIVGVGRIGRAVARRASAFGMEILGYDPHVNQTDLRELAIKLVGLEELLASSDVVTLHSVATPETVSLINKSSLSKMKHGAYLINFARGALIENLDILYEALVEGKLAGVALDVFPEEPPTNLDHPLFHHPNFIGDPHVLASTAATEQRCSLSVVKDVTAVLEGRRPTWCVNPEVFDVLGIAG